jgi:nitrite reductase (NO-forming)
LAVAALATVFALVLGQVVGSLLALPSGSTTRADEVAETRAVQLAPAMATARLAQPALAEPLPARAPAVVPVTIEAQEVVAALDDGVSYAFWTFDGTVPGPMLRVREGDTVDLTFRNAADSKVNHSIDLHAVNGPGGGAKATDIAPGEEARFTFKALNPGVYVYHCATPPAAIHVTNGMYGLIVVEPKEGLPAVDREYYVMQGDFYLQGERGDKGHHGMGYAEFEDELPDYVVFNGSTGSLTGANALKANVGEKVRIYLGVGGPNLTSSFHVIGEIFDTVYPEGASETLSNVQTTLVPAGGATVVEFTTDYPGKYMLVDHSLGRAAKGALGELVVEGEADPAVFHAEQMAPDSMGH